MEEEQIKIISGEIKKISLGLSAMEISRDKEYRKNIKATDEELQEYFKSIKVAIYTGLTSNLIIQEIFSEQLKDENIKQEYEDAVNKLMEDLGKDGAFR